MNGIPKKLYHVTTKENATDILANGLEPRIGERSALCREEKPKIYMTDEKSLPYWQILAGNEAVLEIDTEGIKGIIGAFPERYGFNDYGEYEAYATIEPQYVSMYTGPCTFTEQTMQKLCLLYTDDLSHIVGTVFGLPYARQEKQGKDIDSLTLEWYAQYMKVLLYSLRRLDFSCLDECSRQDIRELLIETAKSGEFTMFDTYFDEGKRVWEKLIEWPQDITYAYRKELYEYIKANLAFCHGIETGGLCF